MLAFLAHEVELRRTREDGTPWLDFWEAAAASGNRDAIKKLIVPRFPESVGYLREWAYELRGRSGVGMEGVAPLTYLTISAWAELTDRQIEPHEVTALLAMDAALSKREPSENTKTVTSGDVVRPAVLTPGTGAWGAKPSQETHDA